VFRKLHRNPPARIDTPGPWCGGIDSSFPWRCRAGRQGGSRRSSTNRERWPLKFGKVNGPRRLRRDSSAP
jgi:hypothetical protein